MRWRHVIRYEERLVNGRLGEDENKDRYTKE